MKIHYLILSTLIATSTATNTHAADEGANNYTQPNMPMMQGPQGQMPMGYYQGQPMNPMMMQRMMRMRERNMQMMDSPENMPIGNMMQHQQQMKDTAAEVSKAAEPYNCPMHRKGGKSERMEMKKKKMAMKQAHMKKVETHLANIEALLQKIVENQ